MATLSGSVESSIIVTDELAILRRSVSVSSPGRAACLTVERANIPPDHWFGFYRQMPDCSFFGADCLQFGYLLTKAQIVTIFVSRAHMADLLVTEFGLQELHLGFSCLRSRRTIMVARTD